MYATKWEIDAHGRHFAICRTLIVEWADAPSFQPPCNAVKVERVVAHYETRQPIARDFFGLLYKLRKAGQHGNLHKTVQHGTLSFPKQ